MSLRTAPLAETRIATTRLAAARLAAALLAVTLLAACTGMSSSSPPSGAAAMQNQNRSY